jgi:dTDP-4-dehydrorhamnose reductase
MKSPILLTGKDGQVGSELSALLPRLGEVIPLNRQQLDLSKPADVRRAIRDIQPCLIVNAAAYTAVDRAESDEETARAVNAIAPAVMAEEARKIGAALVHYSTDYVFDGAKRSPYREEDPPNPINVYGRTKWEGEQAIQNAGVPFLIFRTAWVYGSRGQNFLLTILRLATQREELRIVRDQVGAPTWSREIAAATTGTLEQVSATSKTGSSLAGVSGIYHMTAGGETTWFDFAKAILEETSNATHHAPWLVAATDGSPLITRRVTPITTAEYPTPAHRPHYSILSNSRLEEAFRIHLRDWRTQLHSVFAENRPAVR